MAKVRPFRALRYAALTDKVIAPPYDVISRSKREELLQRDPHNCIHLILGDPSTVTKAELAENRRYAQAARTLTDWKKEGILFQENNPAFYVLKDRFQWRGKALERMGLLLTVRVEEFGSGNILPHERTLATPIADRFALMKATRMQESPIYLTCDDSDQTLFKLLEETSKTTPIAQIRNRDEPIEHSFFRIEDEAKMKKLSQLLLPKPFLIADGHHRYTTALHYSQNEGGQSEEAQWVLALVAPAPSPGVVLSAIHRIVQSPVTFENFKSFETQSVSLSWKEFENSKAPVAWVNPENNEMTLLTPQNSIASIPSEIFNEMILKQIFCLDLQNLSDQSKVRFVKSAEDLCKEIGKNESGFWLRPMEVRKVLELAKEGHVLPQKSTFFYPKVMSGFVFHPL